MSQDPAENFLAHYGVKGMKWGVHKKEDLPAGAPGTPDPMTKPGMPSRSDVFERKFGKSSIQSESYSSDVRTHPGFPHLTPNQKKAALILGGVALAGGALYLANRSGVIDLHRPGGAASAEARKQLHELLHASSNTQLSSGMKHHWDKGVNLKAGALLQRLAVGEETHIRSDGFFASFEPDDVERYKAGLPHWWRLQGYENTSGFMTQIRAGTPVKAPSGKETFDIFKRHLIDDDEVLGTVFPKHLLPKLSRKDRDKLVDAVARDKFPNFCTSWMHTAGEDPHVAKFFAEVGKRGYNALIDFHDSGFIAKTPLRIIDGSQFKLMGSKPVSEEDFHNATRNAKDLVMQHSGLNSSAAENFLAHYGVKGMKWGQRKDDNPTPKTVMKVRDTASMAAKKMTKKVTGASDKHVKQMSDAELQAQLRRLNMERQYKTLNKGAAKAGTEFAQSIGKDVARELVKKAITATATAYLAQKGVKAFMDKKEG